MEEVCDPIPLNVSLSGLFWSIMLFFLYVKKVGTSHMAISEPSFSPFFLVSDGIIGCGFTCIWSEKKEYGDSVLCLALQWGFRLCSNQAPLRRWLVLEQASQGSGCSTQPARVQAASGQHSVYAFIFGVVLWGGGSWTWWSLWVPSSYSLSLWSCKLPITDIKQIACHAAEAPENLPETEYG